MINFIGIGAQRSGTSWVYACLYEHPEICIPIKEIHFFSRERFGNGKEWYEEHFKKCAPAKITGEFSTSYLYSDSAAERIHTMYPEVKIIAILRNPIRRAFSQYGNAIKDGEIPETMPFEEFYKTNASVLEQGLYAKQLHRYFNLFDTSQVLVLVYEDNKNPKEFIQKIYSFLGVRSDFVPSMLNDEINISRVPKHIWIEKRMHRFSEFLRRNGLDTLVHAIRRMGLPDLVRSFNTKPKKEKKEALDRAYLVDYFKEDVAELSQLLGRDLGSEWDIKI